jgi:hypothetical protein
VRPWMDRNVAAAERKEASARTVEERWGVYVDRALQRSGLRPPQISKHLMVKLATLSTLCVMDVAIPLLIERIRVRIGERHTSRNSYVLPNDVEHVIKQLRVQAGSTLVLQEPICSQVDRPPWPPPAEDWFTPQSHPSPSPTLSEVPAPPSQFDRQSISGTNRHFLQGFRTICPSAFTRQAIPPIHYHPKSDIMARCAISRPCPCAGQCRGPSGGCWQ